ncbi:MAG TPA: ABC transporter substrate-binding protein [Candidatus Limnocylindria bacterium]|nr:ABC transporter substrate-binding protein [Candidatus Limnocylindria bacterium]
MRRRLSALRSLPALAALAVVTVLGLGAGGAAAGGPTTQLRAHIDRALRVLEDPALKAPQKARDRRAALRGVADDLFDFTETSRRALGRHWAARTPAERDLFVQLFADILERSYISKVELYGGEKIEYTSESIDADHAAVGSRIVTRQGLQVPIQYRMQRRGDRWLVYDVVIEGVSLVANYRSQFDKIIRTSSFDELVKKMKARQEELGA